MNEILFKSVADIIERIKTVNPELYREWKRNGMVVGIDMHNQQQQQRRYDKKPKDAKTDEDIDNWMSDRYLNKTKYDKGTILCNTIATISCITKKASIFLGVVMVKKGDKTADVVCELLDAAESLEVKPGMLMCDRGFFTTDVIHALNNRIIER